MRRPTAFRAPRSVAFAVAFLVAPCVARAGPPFLTDDPDPTDTGHWEIYGPALDVEGQGSERSGVIEAELNYGAAPNLQLTLDLPAAFTANALGARVGGGDIQFSAKYRFYHDEAHGVSIAIFPGVTLPTASSGLGVVRAAALLPVWGQWDRGPWSVFGGGGYAINPGPGNRNDWTGGLAVSRTFGDRLLIGVEADRHGADTVGGRPSTSLGLGAILQLKAPFRLLASGGPTFVDGQAGAGYHAYLAIGLNF